MSSLAASMGWTFVAIAASWELRSRRLARRHREMVARACHELRGPLTAASLALHSAGRAGGTPAPQLAAFELELLRAGVALDDLCAVLAGRRPQQYDEPVDVRGLLACQLHTWRAMADARGRSVRVGPAVGDALVRGDRVRLAQATSNLVANAIEHGEGIVQLHAREAGGRLVIEVADEGPGLPVPVSQLARRARGGRGRHGRGLAIAEEIAVRHGGRLGSGADGRVEIELPALAVPE